MMHQTSMLTPTCCATSQRSEILAETSPQHFWFDTFRWIQLLACVTKAKIPLWHKQSQRPYRHFWGMVWQRVCITLSVIKAQILDGCGVILQYPYSVHKAWVPDNLGKWLPLEEWVSVFEDITFYFSLERVLLIFVVVAIADWSYTLVIYYSPLPACTNHCTSVKNVRMGWHSCIMSGNKPGLLEIFWIFIAWTS